MRADFVLESGFASVDLTMLDGVLWHVVCCLVLCCVGHPCRTCLVRVCAGIAGIDPCSPFGPYAPVRHHRQAVVLPAIFGYSLRAASGSQSLRRRCRIVQQQMQQKSQKLRRSRSSRSRNNRLKDKSFQVLLVSARHARHVRPCACLCRCV